MFIRSIELRINQQTTVSEYVLVSIVRCAAPLCRSHRKPVCRDHYKGLLQILRNHEGHGDPMLSHEALR